MVLTHSLAMQMPPCPIGTIDTTRSCKSTTLCMKRMTQNFRKTRNAPRRRIGRSWMIHVNHWVLTLNMSTFTKPWPLPPPALLPQVGDEDVGFQRLGRPKVSSDTEDDSGKEDRAAVINTGAKDLLVWVLIIFIATDCFAEPTTKHSIHHMVLNAVRSTRSSRPFPKVLWHDPPSFLISLALWKLLLGNLVRAMNPQKENVWPSYLVSF